MIIPEFNISQTEEDIIVCVLAPCIRPEESEIYVDNNEFLFYSGPYFLRLILPGSLLDSEDTSGFYDNEKLTFTVRVKKSKPGEFFENLESMKPHLKVWNPNQYADDDSENEESIGASEVVPANVETATIDPAPEPLVEKVTNEPLLVKEEPPKPSSKYGFANLYSDMFGKYYNEFAEILDIPNPDVTAESDRREIRLKLEDKKFSDDHYLADTMETESIEPLIKFTPLWSNATEGTYSELEVKVLEQIPVKDMSTIPDDVIKQVHYQLIDILFVYCYNVRTTEGENTVESAWTINKLSATLTFFQTFEDIRDVLVTCYRRCLSYSLYRNFDLVQLIQDDVVKLLQAGPTQVTKSLLEIKQLFDESEQRFVLNRLYIDDYCKYTQSMPADVLLGLAQSVEQTVIDKDELNFDIPILEIAACLVLKQSKLLRDTDDVIEEMKKLKTEDSEDDDDSSSSSSSSTSSEESTTSEDDD